MADAGVETPFETLRETAAFVRRGPPRPPSPRELWPPPPPPDRDALQRIAFGSEHRTLAEALAADLLDVIPIVGDVSNAYRVRDAMKRQAVMQAKPGLQMVDMLLGMLPEPVGAVLDVLTPSSTVNYLRRRSD